MPPFCCLLSVSVAGGAFYGDDRLFFNPLDRLEMGLVSLEPAPGRWLVRFPVRQCRQCRKCGRRSSVVRVCQGG